MKRVYPFSDEDILKHKIQPKLYRIDWPIIKPTISDNFVKIPDEVLIHILLPCFNIHWLFLVGRLVCREWNEMIIQQMENLELDFCFAGGFSGGSGGGIEEEISESFIKCVNNGLFSHCVSDLTLLQIDDSKQIIQMKRKTKQEFKKIMKEEIEFNSKKIMIVSLLRMFNNLEMLDLRSNTIGEHGSYILANCTNLTKLKELNLSGSHQAPNIGKDGFLQFTRSNLLHFSNLTRLSLSQNRLDEESVIALITCETFPKLKSLDLFGNKLDNSAIGFLANSEGIVANLTELNIGFNEYDSEAALFIANSSFLKNLVNLNMAGNTTFRSSFIGDIGVNVLFNSNYLENLTSINLSNNKISDEGAKSIYSSGSKLKNLTKLNLNSNTITSRGASYLAQSKCLVNLKLLFLCFNTIESYGAKVICQHFKCLHELYLRGNRIHNLGAREIAESENLKSIEILDLSLNRFGKEGLTHLSNSKFLPSHVKTQFEERLALISRDVVEDIYSILEESPSVIEI